MINNTIRTDDLRNIILKTAEDGGLVEIAEKYLKPLKQRHTAIPKRITEL